MTAKKKAKPIKRKKAASRKKKAKPFDPAKPLKATKREAFCQNIVNGGAIKASSKGGFTISEISHQEAYSSAGYLSKGKAAGDNAARLIANDRIKARVEHLRAEQALMLAEKGCASKEECCMVLTELVRARHSDYLTMGEDGVNMFDIGEETLNGAALKKIKTRTQRDQYGKITIEKQFDEIELESKIAAIKCLADINGWNKADDTEARKVNVYQEFLEALIDPIPDNKRSPQTG